MGTRSPARINAKVWFIFGSLVAFAAAAAWFETSMELVSAHVTVVDSAFHGLAVDNLCAGLKPLDRADGTTMTQCGMTNSNASVGYVRKGSYELAVWIGDFERVDRLLHKTRVTLTKKDQPVWVQLKGVVQQVTLWVDSEGKEVVLGDIGELVTIKEIKAKK